jgi:hypothetical protein
VVKNQRAAQVRKKMRPHSKCTKFRRDPIFLPSATPFFFPLGIEQNL